MAVPWLIGTIIGTFLVVSFWDEIVDWLKDCFSIIRERLSQLKKKVENAMTILADKVREGIAMIKHMLYYKEQGKWYEEVTRREINESELPPQVRARIAKQRDAVIDDIAEENGVPLTVTH